MKLFEGIGNFFRNKTTENEQNPKAQSKLKGKMIKDYTLQNKITQFTDPPTQLVVGVKQGTQRVSVYALDKKLLTQQSFIAYQNSLANNYTGVYPQYLEHVQSANYIYIILEELSLPQDKSWMAQDLLRQIDQFYGKIKQKISLNGILVNKNKKIVYLPPYQDMKSVSKFFYEGINKPVFAELFCKVFQLPQKSKQQVSDAIIQYAGTDNLKSQVLKILAYVQKSTIKNQNKWNQQVLNPNKPLVKQSEKGFIGKASQINAQTSQSLYPDLSAEDEQIMKLISVVRINPKLIQEAEQFHQMRASSRARHQNDEQTKQIGNVIDSANKSMFEINKVVKKSSMKTKFQIKENQKKISENQFQLYCTTYISIFKHFKKSVKSSLTYYTTGFSGIINAYFITLIGILRRSKLVYALNHDYDLFCIGCQSVNVQFYTGKLKKELISQAKILTDLRQMIFRCYIPMKTFQILSPYLDDRIENIDLTKLEDFCFFYMTSLIRNKIQKNVYFIYMIQFMYIILHRNFEIVHFQNEVPKKWDEDFFELRKQLIESMVPNWNI